MTAATKLGQALVQSGVTTVFANPGTTELHLVEGFAATPGLRQILTLFEGVASGAADGFARMTGTPAAALLHLGPGFANAMANLHNARRANSPVVALVGDHALNHRKWDTPLQSDIAGMARTVSVAVQDCTEPSRLAHDGAAAIARAIEARGVSTLIIPSDVAWSGAEPESALPTPRAARTDEFELANAVTALSSAGAKALIVGGGRLTREGLATARAIASATGAQLLAETFLPAMARGGGDPGPEVIPYFSEMATARLAAFDSLVLVGAKRPVGFFSYPGRPADCVPPGARLCAVQLGSEGLDGALFELAGALGIRVEPSLHGVSGSPLPGDGPLTAAAVGLALAALMPENAIISDEANTTGPELFGHTANARLHDWLRLTGGAIGQGLPLATGAAVACPERRVIALQSDGSALYTFQALWTQAREHLNVTTLLLNNRSYAILQYEMMRMQLGAQAEQTGALFELVRPEIDFVALAQGMGVRARRVETVNQLLAALEEGLSNSGPCLIDVILTSDR